MGSASTVKDGNLSQQHAPSLVPKASPDTNIASGVLVPLRLGPELLPGVGGFLCWHHFQPLLVISSKAINLLQVGVVPFVL